MADVVAFLASTLTSYGPLAAVVVSALAVTYGVFGSGRWNRMSSMEEAMAHRIDDLSTQVKELREANRDCARRCRDLESENLTMLRRIAKMQNGGDH